MSHVKFTIAGLDDLRAALRSLPADLASDAADLITAHAATAAERIYAAYPEGPTGHLKGGVRFRVQRSQFGAIGIVQNFAFHAWIFEHGTQARHSRFGNRGAMRPGHVFVPILMEERRQLFDDLRPLLERRGLIAAAGNTL